MEREGKDADELAESKHDGQAADRGREGKDGEAAAEDEVIVRFLIQPEGFPHFMSLARSSTVDELKRMVADDLQLPPSAMLLSGAGLESHSNLLHLEAGKQYEVNLSVSRTGSAMGGNRLHSASAGSSSVIDVVVHFEDEDVPSKTFQVELVWEQNAERKPYLGGYRHKMSGIEYYHAATQRFSDKLRLAERGGPTKLTRETQTAIVQSRTSQTKRESGTQMARPDLYLDTSKDRELSPRPYFDSEQLFALREQCTLTIQRYWRGCVARGRATDLRRERTERIEAQERLRAQREREEKEQHQREVERRMNPKSASDFEVLYNELENWRQHETTRIKSDADLTPEMRREQLEELLHKETKLLQTIDKLKLTANSNNREKRINKVLAMMAAPKKWQMADGDIALVHTPFTTRAKELLELYHGLKAAGTSVDERLDVLLHVKWTAKEFDCDLTRDLVDLIDREADLLNRGRSEKAMVGLRKRICTLFLQFIETPDFNPEAERFQQAPPELLDRPQIAPK